MIRYVGRAGRAVQGRADITGQVAYVRTYVPTYRRGFIGGGGGSLINTRCSVPDRIVSGVVSGLDQLTACLSLPYKLRFTYIIPLNRDEVVER